MINGVYDGWYKFFYVNNDDEEYFFDYEGGVDNILLMFLVDVLFSMLDMLMCIGGVYDLYGIYFKMVVWESVDIRNEGRLVVVRNLFKDVMKVEVFSNIVILDVEFKKWVDLNRGNGWFLIWIMVKMLEKGRMDIDVVIVDENMELLVVV